MSNNEPTLEEHVDNLQKMFAGADMTPLGLTKVNYGVLDVIEELAKEGAISDDPKRKQWCLVQIATILDHTYTVPEKDKPNNKIIPLHSNNPNTPH